MELYSRRSGYRFQLFTMQLVLSFMMTSVLYPSPSPGELFTLAVLDRERVVEYNMVAKATDGGGRSCQADILLMVQDMNDNAPRFSSSHYEVTVFDNTTVRTPIAVIYAKDPDTGRPAF